MKAKRCCDDRTSACLRCTQRDLQCRYPTISLLERPITKHPAAQRVMTWQPLVNAEFSFDNYREDFALALTLSGRRVCVYSRTGEALLSPSTVCAVRVVINKNAFVEDGARSGLHHG
ncbi:hypothetical protein HD806DRAFT_515999 [Xylariaceae sp. AK1471]|nr:hypothetical protein HD806DRAFT_515999 [Xylariaceae sp. AK1471]